MRTSTTNSIAFDESNGTYAFSVGPVPGYTVSPSAGNVTVRGVACVQEVRFSRVANTTYTVWFNETGLPPGTAWSANLGGGPRASATSSILFMEPAGRYPFSVGAVGSRLPSPSEGNVTVAASSVSIKVWFTFTYALTFMVPQGIANGTVWSVTLDSAAAGGLARLDPAAAVTRISTSPSIVFEEPNGTYSYSVRVSGDPEYQGNGSVTIWGNPTVVTPPPVTPPHSGAYEAGGSNDALIVGAIAVAAVVLALSLVVLGVRSSRRRRPPSS